MAREREPDILLVMPSKHETSHPEYPDDDFGELFRNLDRIHPTERDVPDYFSGLAESAAGFGLEVKEIRSAVPRPSQRLVQSSSTSLMPIMALASQWVILILSDRDVRAWLGRNAPMLWDRLIREDEDAYRVAFVDRDGPIPQDYSQTFAVMARIPEGIVYLHIRDNCPEHEFETTLSLFSDYLAERRGRRSADRESGGSAMTLLGLGRDGALEEIDLGESVRSHRAGAGHEAEPPLGNAAEQE